MEKVRLLIIDDNESLRQLVKEYFDSSSTIDVVLEASDGKEGIEIINSNVNNFDMILLDLVMPNKDGIEVLKYLRKEKIDKKVIFTTSYNSQEIIRMVAELEANYFMLKPYELESKGINLYSNNLQLTITKTLHELGVPSHIKGYQYIREGVTLVYNNPTIIGGITKELYPEIAK